MILGTLRSLPVLALTTAAKTLRLLATINETIAQRLDTPSPAPPSQTQARTPHAGPARAAPVAAPAAADIPGTAAAETAAKAAADIPALAARTVPEVLAGLDALSTTELGELYSYESSHRRRRSVLRAVEAASAPPQLAGEPDDLPPLDVRVDDELVYSTATPPR